MSDGQILQVLKTRIENELRKKKISANARAQYELLQLFVIYLEDDHRKVEIMWTTYKPFMWGAVIFATAFIGAFATGRISIGFIK